MLSQQALLWIGFAISALLFLGQWVDPANAKTPWNWSGTSRVIAFAIVSCVVGILQQVSASPDTPWAQSLVVAVLTFVPALLGHFAHAALPISSPAVAGKRGFIDGEALRALFGAFGLVVVCTAIAACAGFWTPAREGAAEDFAACVVVQSAALVVDADLTPAQEAAVGAKCASNPADVHDFLAGHREQLASAQAVVKAARSSASCR